MTVLIDFICRWTLNGETINSGDNYNVQYMESVLTLRVEVW